MGTNNACGNVHQPNGAEHLSPSTLKPVQAPGPALPGFAAWNIKDVLVWFWRGSAPLLNFYGRWKKKKKLKRLCHTECVHIDLTNHGWNLAAALRGEGPHDSDAGISASFFPMNTHVSSACEMEKCASTAGCSGPLHY